MILSESAAKQLWPGQNPIGQMVKIGRMLKTDAAWRVVGVVGRRTQNLFGELLDGLDDEFLVVVGGQVEVVLAAGLQPGGLLVVGRGL